MSRSLSFFAKTVQAQNAAAAAAESSSSTHNDLVSVSSSAVPAHVVLAQSLSRMGLTRYGSKGKGKRKQGRYKELHIDVGNDQKYPFLKRPSTREFIHRVVSGVPTEALLTSSTTVPVFTSKYFAVSTIQHFSSYSTIFDEYMIEAVELLVEPQVTEVISIDLGSVVTVIDLDDASTPSSIADLAAYETCVSSRGTKSHYHRWQPSAAVAAYSGTFTSYANVQGLWIDCASSGVQHYGFKMGVAAAATNQSFTWQYRLHVVFRGKH